VGSRHSRQLVTPSGLHFLNKVGRQKEEKGSLEEGVDLRSELRLFCISKKEVVRLVAVVADVADDV